MSHTALRLPVSSPSDIANVRAVSTGSYRHVMRDQASSSATGRYWCGLVPIPTGGA